MPKNGGIRHKAMRASRFVLLTLKPMQRIAMDTIGPMEIFKKFRYILVIIDTFTRYVELFPTKYITATLMPFRHAARDHDGSWFSIRTMNQILSDFANGVRHHSTIPYSKEENRIVERANK
jgi:hypothetical protein